MNLGPRLLKHTALLALLPALALAGCQTAGTPVGTQLTANPNAPRGMVQIVLGGARQAEERSVLGAGFADTTIVAARVTVIGTDMVKESKTVPWDGQAALNVGLNVPVGNSRLFVLEALDADPGVAASEPTVIASIRGVANVAAGSAVTIDLNYNSDAVGRVVESLQAGLSHGFDQALYGDLAKLSDVRRGEILASLTTSATFVGELQTFVTKITKFQAPDTAKPNGTYTGVHPLYFNAEHLVGLILKSGAAAVAGEPPLPLEAFRATGELTVYLDTAIVGPGGPELEVTLQVPFSRFTEGGLFHLDRGVVSLRTGAGGTSAIATFKDVPPGYWGVVATSGDEQVGAARVKVRHGQNEGRLTVTTAGSVSPPSPESMTLLLGTVKDEDGAFVDGGTVTVRSLNPSQPFETTVAVNGGDYGVNVPAGVQLEVTATKTGWTSRRRVQTLPLYTTSRINFGSDNQDAEGAAYFISDYPEIESAVVDAATTDGTHLAYTITLSEPLDATNQRRFAAALRVTGDFAPQGGGVPTIDEDSVFLNEDRQAHVTWDAAGKVATLSFEAPLYADDDDPFSYRLRLRDAGFGIPIEDAAGNELGFRAPSPGGLYTDVFRLGSPALTTSDTTAGQRWAATHVDSASFEVSADETNPTLTAVNVTTLSDRTRINLTFSEPMAVHGDAGPIYGHAFGATVSRLDDEPVTDDVLSHFTFAVGDTAGELDAVALDGEAALPLSVDGVIGDSPAERGTEFKLTAGAANVFIEVDPFDPKVLRIDVGRSDLFAVNLNAIKARVAGISDPAGNAITDTSGDANVKSGSI